MKDREQSAENGGEREEPEELFARIYEEKLELPQALRQGVRELSCLSFQEDQQVYLLCEENGRRSVLKTAAGSRISFLETEAESLKRFHFSFTPEIYAAFQEKDRFFLWKEYIVGDTLFERIERNGPMEEAEAGRLMIRLCEMLGQFHSCDPPLIHRDLKPQNIVLTPEDNLFLIDLETSREYREEAEFDTVFAGTRQTAAPEQYGFRQTDGRTDIYALGIVCLYLLTGSMEIQREDVLSLLSPPFAHLIKTCTKLDPRDRYQTCGELKAALGIAMNGGVPDHPRKKKRRRIACAAAAAAALLCLFAGGEIWRYYQWEHGEYDFSSELIEQAVRMELGREEGKVTGAELELITSLRICGDEIMDEAAFHSSYCTEHNINGTRVESHGNIRSLEDCAHMKNLHTLVLDRQLITDLSPLKGLPLEYVSLCDNEISQIAPLAFSPQLRELYLEENAVEDLGPLAQCTELKVLDISSTYAADFSPLEGLPIEKFYQVGQILWEKADPKSLDVLEGLPLKVLHLSHIDGAEMAAGRISTLEDLALYDYSLPALEPLLGLKNLKVLTLLSGAVEDLEGVDSFSMLRRLNIDMTRIADLSPLAGCGELETLTTAGSEVRNYDVLRGLKKLTLLGCDPVQEPAVYKAVPEPWFQVQVSE